MHPHPHKPPHCSLLIQRLNSGRARFTLYPDRHEDSGMIGEKPCCDILYPFAVPKSNEQGHSGTAHEPCLQHAGRQTRKEPVPWSRWRVDKTDGAPWKPQETARHQTLPTEPKTDHQPQSCKRARGRARATPCLKSCSAPHPELALCQVKFHSLSSPPADLVPVCSVLNESNGSLFTFALVINT